MQTAIFHVGNLVSRSPALRRASPQICCAVGCRTETNGHKPYCIDHLGCLPSVRAIEAELSRREAQLGMALDPGHRASLDPSGTQATEMLEELETHGALTIERLAAIFQIPLIATEGYVRALEASGEVTVLRLGSRRGGVRRVVQRVAPPPIATAGERRGLPPVPGR